MKAIFASLLCLVLTVSQVFALKGGPAYPPGDNLPGVYAGVLQGVFDPTTPASSNSIGVFSLGVPTTGIATGPFVMFSRGRVFSGTIQATADPTKASIKGVLDASFNYNLFTTVTDTTTDASGNVTTTTHIETLAISAKANGPLSSTVSSTKSKNLTKSATIINGTATLNISQGQVASNGDPVIVSILSLVVSGFKQSETPPTTTTIGSGG